MSTSLPIKAKDSLPRDPDEKIILTYICEIIDEDIAATNPDIGGVLFGSTQTARICAFKGIMVLTNKHLFFVEQMFGFFGYKDEYSLRDIIPLESTKAMNVFKHSHGGLRLNVSYEESGKKHDRGFKGKDRNQLNRFRDEIEEQRINRIREVEEAKKKERIQIVIDFSFLKNEMEKGGITLTTIKCPNCSGDVDIPEHGDIFTCQYCQSKIKAVDIFERMKGLLSNI